MQSYMWRNNRLVMKTQRLIDAQPMVQEAVAAVEVVASRYDGSILEGRETI